VVVIRPDRDPLSELLEGPEVIAVPMRCDVMVDLRNAGILRRLQDTSRVSRGGSAAVASVDEHRFAGRRHEERGVSALHVDDIDVQRAMSLCRGQNRPGDEHRDQGGECDAHIESPGSAVGGGGSLPPSQTRDKPPARDEHDRAFRASV
jgi:hypothetical protein